MSIWSLYVYVRFPLPALWSPVPSALTIQLQSSFCFPYFSHLPSYSSFSEAAAGVGFWKIRPVILLWSVLSCGFALQSVGAPALASPNHLMRFSPLPSDSQLLVLCLTVSQTPSHLTALEHSHHFRPAVSIILLSPPHFYSNVTMSESTFHDGSSETASLLSKLIPFFVFLIPPITVRHMTRIKAPRGHRVWVMWHTVGTQKLFVEWRNKWINGGMQIFGEG